MRARVVSRLRRDLRAASELMMLLMPSRATATLLRMSLSGRLSSLRVICSSPEGRVGTSNRSGSRPCTRASDPGFKARSM